MILIANTLAIALTSKLCPLANETRQQCGKFRKLRNINLIALHRTVLQSQTKSSLQLISQRIFEFMTAKCIWHARCIENYVLASSDASLTLQQVRNLPVELFGYYRS
jgi:hypothetical protein